MICFLVVLLSETCFHFQLALNLYPSTLQWTQNYSGLRTQNCCGCSDWIVQYFVFHCESWLQRKSDKGMLSTCRHGRPQITCRLLYKSTLCFVFGLILWKWMNRLESADSNQECKIGYKHLTNGLSVFGIY